MLTTPAEVCLPSSQQLAMQATRAHITSRMPQHIPEIMHEDSSVHSLDSIQSPHISSVPSSSFSDQQLAEERAEEAANEVSAAAQQGKDKASQQATKAGESAKDFGKKAEKKGEELKLRGTAEYNEMKKQAGAEYKETKKEAGAEYEKMKKEAGVEKEKAKKNAKEAEDWADTNKDNPVVIGNAVAVAAIAGLLGFGAYRKHIAGELTWKVAGAWAGIVGLFAVGDFYMSQ